MTAYCNYTLCVYDAAELVLTGCNHTYNKLHDKCDVPVNCVIPCNHTIKHDMYVKLLR